jgi:hypothetical protein
MIGGGAEEGSHSTPAGTNEMSDEDGGNPECVSWAETEATGPLFGINQIQRNLKEFIV